MSSQQDSYAGSKGHISQKSNSAWIAITILFSISVVGIVGLTGFFWKMPYGMGPRQVLLCLVLGVFISLPCLFSVWCALGSQHWMKRIPMAMGMQFVLFGVYIGRIGSMQANMAWEIVALFAAVLFSLTIAIQIPFWIFRFSTSACFRRAGTSSMSVGETQFGIRHLLIAMTLIAMIVAARQFIIPDLKLTPSGGLPPIRMIVSFCAIFIALIWLLTLLSIAVVFSNGRKLSAVIILVIANAIVPMLVAGPVLKVIQNKPGPLVSTHLDTLWNIYAFTLSLTLSLVVIFVFFYCLGYRLLGPKPAT
jgi:hypothetical protein